MYRQYKVFTAILFCPGAFHLFLMIRLISSQLLPIYIPVDMKTDISSVRQRRNQSKSSKPYFLEIKLLTGAKSE